MPAQRPVKIIWQIIFTLIPVVDLWAFYRIKKLRKYILWVYFPVIIITMLIVIPETLSEIDTAQEGELGFYDEFTVTDALLFIVEAGFTIFAIYLIYNWSKEWNKQFPSASDSDL